MESNESTPPDQMQLALDRTYLAYERTLMAWIRTATSLITFGFTLYKFFLYMDDQKKQQFPVARLLGPRTYGLIMMGIGVFVLAAASVQHYQVIKRMRKQSYQAPPSLAALTAAVIAALGIVGFLAAVFEQ